jgi:spore germination cell wall hydrolase CwlJ-like protein
MLHRWRWHIILTAISLVVLLPYKKIDHTLHTVPHKELLENFNIITPSIAKTDLHAMEVDKTSVLYNKKDLKCLTQNIFFEAGTESMLGKIAVGQVTLNRVKMGYWGETICDVVNAKDQFSWTNKDDINIDETSKNYLDSKLAAKKVLENRHRLRMLKHAIFYHADYVRPNWIDKNKKIIQIDKHIFYNGAKGSNLSLEN